MSYIINICGGGFFSIYHQVLEEFLYKHYNNILSINDILQFKIVIHDSHIFNNKTMFHDIFVYDNSKIFENVVLNNDRRWFHNINNHPELLPLLKTIINKNTITDKLNTTVNDYCSLFDITENTLGVHIRLTDMNATHPEHGIFTIQCYIDKINKLINTHRNINNIYLASDNIQSINHLKEYYKNIIKISYIEDNVRSLYENDDCNYVINAMNNDNTIATPYHVEIMIEMLVLSKCSYFIHRVSDFANFAIIYSDTFKLIEYL
jgi:hypothetical protein